MAWAWHGMASVNQTRPHCVNQIGKKHSKPLAARHGRGTAWARHATCESAFIRRAVQVTVATIGTSHCYQPQTQSYQHSVKVKSISRRNHLGPICAFRPNKMKY